MSQIIMLFLFPLGLYFYFFKERPSRPTYNKVFSDFEKKIQRKNVLSRNEKLENYEMMLLKNDYKIIEKTSTFVVGEKTIFSMSLFTIGVGLYFIGAVFYLLYFFYIQKPHRVTFYVQNQENIS